MVSAIPSALLALLSALVADVFAAGRPLAPSPALLQQKDTSQCGCNNTNLLALSPPSGQEIRELRLTGFFFLDAGDSMSTCGETPQSRSATGHLLPATYIALDEINNSSDILPGYFLTLDVRNSKCDPLHATTEFVETIEDRIQGRVPANSSLNLGVLGPGCDAVADSLAGLISRSLRLPVVSYSPNLFPLSSREDAVSSVLFHITRSLLFTAQSAIGIIRQFGWTNNIAFVSQESFLLTIESVVNTADEADDEILLNDGSGIIHVAEFVQFGVGPDGLASDSLMQVLFENIRRKNIRIIFAVVTPRIGAQIICTGKRGTIPGNGFVYVFAGSFSEDWWLDERNPCELTIADVQSTLIVSGNMINPNSSSVLKSGITVHDFKEEYKRRRNMWCDVSRYQRNSVDLTAGSVYDAVWSLALALNETTDLIDIAIRNNIQYDLVTLNAMAEALRNVNFNGVTGKVGFEGGDRTGADIVQQMQDGEQVQIGLYEYSELHLILSRSFMWNGSSNITPSAEVHRELQGVDLHWLVISMVFSVTGILVAIIMWGCNCYFSKHRILRASSQQLNYAIIVGVIFGYLTVLLLTILESPLGSLMNDTTFKVLCLIRIWMLPLAFTFTYGILFARAWRIYRIFNNPWAASRPYKDIHLLLMVFGVAAIDVLILIPWTIIDPYRRFLILTDVDYDSFSVCVFSSCSSDMVTVWLSVLSIYKIAIILGCLVVISLVRKEVIERKIFDDSKSLAWAVYITTGAFIVGLPLTVLFLLSDRVVLAYIASAAWVNVSSWGTQLTVFIPKFYKIVVKKDDGKSYKRARRLYYGREFSKQFSTTHNLTYITDYSESTTV